MQDHLAGVQLELDSACDLLAAVVMAEHEGDRLVAVSRARCFLWQTPPTRQEARRRAMQAARVHGPSEGDGEAQAGAQTAGRQDAGDSTDTKEAP